ncbi:MAG: hypothetical protein K8S16_00755 [Bacteroidales bacterium]|nr:hypothetical protein [Bacteroidales bacterium]
MELKSYSERGLINSLIYEIHYHKQSTELLTEFINLIYFPKNKYTGQIIDYTIYVEQSLSQFGDSDLIFLLETKKGDKVSIFGEAKVKTCEKIEWLIEKEFEEFKTGLNNTLNSSNLFTQLYHKYKFHKASCNELKNGIKFPKPSTRKIRKIGNNDVVIRAMTEIKKYSNKALYLSIIPDNIDNVIDFYNNALNNFFSEIIPDFDANNYCFITWKSIYKFCSDNKLTNTLECFKHNECQIYKSK